jgi:RimJ/RimL family protein N-acetyltransferase
MPAPPAVRVRATTEDDLPDLVAMWNDGRVMRWIGFPDGLGTDAEQARAWWERTSADPNRHHFVVEADGIGFAGELFYRVEPEARRAGLDIKLVAAAHGRGIASAGLTALCERVWNEEPDVDAVWVEPHPLNEAARRLYARLGFRPLKRPPDLPPADSYWELRRPG